MPHSCSAWSCTNRCTVQARARGITFHCFPKNKDLRKQWELALRRKGFTANKSTRLCSAHFRKDDFDTTGQTVRLREGVIPSVFSFPAHRQKPLAARKTLTSKRAQQKLPVERSKPITKSEPAPGPSVSVTDHAYALPTPIELRARLNEALARIETLEREKRNTRDRERRARNAVQGLLEVLKRKKRTNEELRKKLDSLVKENRKSSNT